MHEPGHGVVSFFSSRRAPSGPFHLLQNMYLQRLWGKRRRASRTHRPGRICRWLTPSPSRLRFTTSSLYAGRVLGGMPLIGTWAHEGPMAFMGLYADLDGSLPLSSVLWTVLFWAATSNKSILPDGCGSAAYKAAICGLGLFEDVAMARQDSGSLERFASLFNCPRMASEVSLGSQPAHCLAWPVTDLVCRRSRHLRRWRRGYAMGTSRSARGASSGRSGCKGAGCPRDGRMIAARFVT